MSVPRVSILMPVRNEADYLAAALDSLFRQSLTDWELVVVDDGSSDATPDILSVYQRRDSRVRVLRKEGGGLVAALNAGLAECRAALIARMDGDDICHPSRLDVQAHFLDTHPDIGLVACRFHHFPRSAITKGMQEYQKWQNGLHEHDLITADLFVESPFVHPSIMTRRLLLLKMEGYRECPWAEDYDLWLRMAAAGVRFSRLPEALFFWRDHPQRATRTMNEYSLDAFRNCKLHYLLNGFLKGVESVVIAGAGLEGRAWQRLLASHSITVSQWLDVDPRKIGRQLHGALVTSPAELAPPHDKLLVAIGVRGARQQFRNLAANSGLNESRDFVCVA